MNFSETGIRHPTPVGIFPLGETPERIQDMAGNVREWCQDWFADYPAGKVSNPPGTSEATRRVFRGGGWNRVAWFCRAAVRVGIEPEYQYVDLGFRVAAVPPGKSSKPSK